MFLHKDKKRFVKLVQSVSASMEIDEALIEKDYYSHCS